MSKISNNFSEFLQEKYSQYIISQSTNIYKMLAEEFDGILKQIKLLIKSNNACVEYSVIEEKFNNILEKDSPEFINSLASNQYNTYYQELFSKIIREGGFSLKSNRYSASNERTEVLEKTLSNYEENLKKSNSDIIFSIELQVSNFIKNFVLSSLLLCLENEFFELPCKQNEKCYKDIQKNVLTKSQEILSENIIELCKNNKESLAEDVSSYLREKIRFEKGYTNVNLDRLIKSA